MLIVFKSSLTYDRQVGWARQPCLCNILGPFAGAPLGPWCSSPEEVINHILILKILLSTWRHIPEKRLSPNLHHLQLHLLHISRSCCCLRHFPKFLYHSCPIPAPAQSRELWPPLCGLLIDSPLLPTGARKFWLSFCSACAASWGGLATFVSYWKNVRALSHRFQHDEEKTAKYYGIVYFFCM